MKIINKENGAYKVYVQLNDLMVLIHSDCEVPASVLFGENSPLFEGGAFIVTDENRFSFLEFTNPADIRFFKDTDWIIDYREYKDFSGDALIEEGQKISREMNRIAKEWNDYNEDERMEHVDLRNRHELLNYKMMSLAQLLWSKQGHVVTPFPIAADDCGFSVNNKDSLYIAKQGLNPLQVLFYRKDGKKLDAKKDIIPSNLIQAAEGILIDTNLEHNEFFGDFERTRDISSDGKYFISTFRIITPEEKEQKQKEELVQQELAQQKEEVQVKSDKKEERTLTKRLLKGIKNHFNYGKKQ